MVQWKSLNVDLPSDLVTLSFTCHKLAVTNHRDAVWQSPYIFKLESVQFSFEENHVKPIYIVTFVTLNFASRQIAIIDPTLVNLWNILASRFMVPLQPLVSWAFERDCRPISHKRRRERKENEKKKRKKEVVKKKYQDNSFEERKLEKKSKNKAKYESFDRTLGRRRLTPDHPPSNVIEAFPKPRFLYKHISFSFSKSKKSWERDRETLGGRERGGGKEIYI